MKIFVDTMNLIFISYHMARKQLKDGGEEFTEDKIGFYLHMLLNKFHFIFSNYDDITFCWEGRGSKNWRKGIFPDYKGNRTTDEQTQVVFDFMPKLEELLSYYPCKQIKVDGTEADDVIYALCEKYQDEEIIVLSTDGDLAQLSLFFPNVEVYNPILKKVNFPSEHLVIEKAIVGDKSDNIPGIHRIGPKTLEKMLNDAEEWDKVMSKGNNKTIFEDFLKIVDLRKFPKEKHLEIQEVDENTKINEFKPDLIEMFLWGHALKELLERWETTKANIYMNKEGKNES